MPYVKLEFKGVIKKVVKERNRFYFNKCIYPDNFEELYKITVKEIFNITKGEIDVFIAPHQLQGIWINFIPDIFHKENIDEIFHASKEDSYNISKFWEFNAVFVVEFRLMQLLFMSLKKQRKKLIYVNDMFLLKNLKINIIKSKLFLISL